MKKKVLLIDHDLHIKDYLKEIKTIFKSNSFTQGVYNKKFTKELNKYLKVKHSFLTTSATTALSICLEALNIKKGDYVAVSDYSWISTAHVIENIGANPVFINVDKETFNMCPGDLEHKINMKIKAIIFVHSFGNPSNLAKVNKIAKLNKIPVIEDAACALGSKYNKNFVGNGKNLCCFSFHQRKILTTGEGGLITTNNFGISKKIQKLLSLGIKKNLKSGFNDFINSGYNYRLTEIQCLIGYKQIKLLNKKISIRKKIHNNYCKELIPLGFKPQKIKKNCKTNYQSCVFVVPKKISSIKLINYLNKKRIDSTIGTYSLSNTKFYKKKYNSGLKKSLFLFKNSISFPCHEKINFKKIINLIKSYK